jgi:hypothetical protein
MTPSPSVLLVVPDAEDRPSTRRLLGLARALAARPDLELTVLTWRTGPLVADFAAVAPAVDAGEVNLSTAARVLNKAQLGPAARLVKNRHLQRLLAPLARTPIVVVGGLGALPALAWLDRPGATAVVVLATDDRDVDRALLARADLVVATDPEVADWAVEAGVDPSAVRRHALAEGPELADTAPSRVGLIGWTPEEVARLAAVLTTADPEVAMTWFVDEPTGWALWNGPTASPLAAKVKLAPPHPRTSDLVELTSLLVGHDRSADRGIVGAARTFGVPVLALGPDGIDEAPARAADVRRPDDNGTWTRSVETGLAALHADLRAAADRS